MRKKTRVSPLVAILVTGIVILLTAFVSPQRFGDYTSVTYFFSWISVLLLLYCLVSWRRITGTFFSLFALYMVSFYLFTLGQSLLFALNIPFYRVNMMHLEGIPSFLEAQQFSILCFALLHLGGVFAHRVNFASHSKREPGRALEVVGKGLFFLSLIPTIAMFGKLASVYLSDGGGYRLAFEAIQGNTSFGKLFSALTEFYVPSLILLLIYYRNQKRKRRLYALAYVAYGMCYFFLGDRTGAASILLSYFWMQSFVFSGEVRKRRTSAGIVIVSLILLISFPILGVMRNSDNKSATEFTAIMFNEQNSLLTLVRDSIEGMGYSTFPLIKTMELIPAQLPYRNGQSYFFGLTALVPNVFGGTHIAVKYSGLARWLQETLLINYGPGYSIPAEAWYNFGWYGSLVMLLFGFGFYRVMDIRNIREGNALTAFVALCFFVVTITTPRRELLTLVRDVETSVMLPYFLVLLVGGFERRHVRYNQ